jgi:hypothetical protein
MAVACGDNVPARRRTPRPDGSRVGASRTATVLVAIFAILATLFVTATPGAAHTTAAPGPTPVCTRARVVPVLRAARPGDRLNFRRSPLLCAGRWAFMEPVVNNDFGLHMYARRRAGAWHNVSIVRTCRNPSRLPPRIAQTCLSN